MTLKATLRYNLSRLQHKLAITWR